MEGQVYCTINHEVGLNVDAEFVLVVHSSG